MISWRSTKQPAPAGPQFPQKGKSPVKPPAKILPPDEELPPDEPSFGEPGDSYEELPPSKSTVDPPELVNDQPDDEIERTMFDPPAARAKP